MNRSTIRFDRPEIRADQFRTKRLGLYSLWGLLSSVCLVLLLAGCATPIGADRVTTRQAYAQVEANALRNGKPSARP